MDEMTSPRPDTTSASAGADAADDGASSESWIEQRLGLKGLDYRIPDGAMKPAYMLGGLTAFFLALLFLTGLYLAQFYNPSPSGAYDSVLYIITRAPMGDWVRSLHHWASSGVVITVVLHLVLVFARRSYRRPREATWWAGVGMAGLLFLLLVTGAALRYDQEGFEALAHFVAGGNLTGVIGQFFTEDFTLSTPLLPRIFSLHTSLLPLAVIGLMGLHFWLIRQLGIDAPGERSTAFRRHAVKLTGLGLLTWALVGVLAVVAPDLVDAVADGDRATLGVVAVEGESFLAQRPQPLEGAAAGSIEARARLRLRLRRPRAMVVLPLRRVEPAPAVAGGLHQPPRLRGVVRLRAGDV